MIDTIVLIVTLLIFFLVIVVISRSVIKKQSIIGRPPIPVFYFILAKMLVIVSLVFLLLKGLKINVNRVFGSLLYLDWIALVFLVIGTIILFLSAIQLNYDLIFGLSSSNKHKLHTKGIYSISRHPFYLGFIFILFSSCLFTPHYVNIAAFLGTWFIHHIIMIKEEQFLFFHYGHEYKQYAEKVKRYITLF
jgi:protein-S-isoprenylcysteine O-methyltransferase Ste14